VLAGTIAMAGAVVGVPALTSVGVILGALALAREAWFRRGLRGLHYQRSLSTTRCVQGDEVAVSVRVWNRSLLPIGRITTDDQASQDIRFREQSMGGPAATSRSALSNVWTLLPFERVERRFHLLADRRGRLVLGPVHLETADLFVGIAAAGDIQMPGQLIVAPRSVPVRQAGARSRWSPVARPASGFPEDPALVAGVRAYQPGDPPRRIHWKATARTGTPSSKHYEASRQREVVVVVDIQTEPGRMPSGRHDPDLVEAICVTAASLLRHGLANGVRCGLAAAAYTHRPSAQVRILPGSGTGQLLALMDALGRASPMASGPFESLLGGVARWLPQPTDLVVVTSRSVTPYMPILRRLRALGFGIRVVVVGQVAQASAADARGAGFRISAAALTPDWRTADALALAG